MARTPKPWFRADRNAYFVTINGDRHNLGSDKAEADRLFHELMAVKDLPAPTVPTGPTTVEIFDKFLDWCEKHREKRTFEWYRDHIQDFLNFSPAVCRQPVADLKPFHVVEWADSHEDWGPAYRRGGIVAIQRPFNWGEKLGYIPATPIKHIEKPKPNRRENAVSPADWKKIKAHYPPGDPFALLLEFSWESGCRPQESKRIEARHVEFGRERVVFPAEEAKGKKRPRVIHLTPPARLILAVLVRDNPTGPVFLNEDGVPWTAQAMSCRFGRLKKHFGIKFAAYDFRHGFCERLLESGADHLTVAELLGHADGKMVATTYSHLHTADRHLRDTLKKASGDASA
ncbi:tyrosine-type recombinase/integrase [Gemmata sp. G18]|uniref:Tyrosine-type recombinase/integrase n=1 Tax=Gemmata palustris TaxID=2822762 RepID=A0ABS5BYT9_9BACT|nr:tyrosine-type recombinase/integrase [Gemmata palustris]MBP3958415.1 tyrosine-type recombinase/integrase [Gemmata palustris]